LCCMSELDRPTDKAVEKITPVRNVLVSSAAHRHHLNTASTYCFATLLDHLLRSSYPAELYNPLSPCGLGAGVCFCVSVLPPSYAPLWLAPCLRPCCCSRFRLSRLRLPLSPPSASAVSAYICVRRTANAVGCAVVSWKLEDLLSVHGRAAGGCIGCRTPRSHGIVFLALLVCPTSSGPATPLLCTERRGLWSRMGRRTPCNLCLPFARRSKVRCGGYCGLLNSLPLPRGWWSCLRCSGPISPLLGVSRLAPCIAAGSARSDVCLGRWGLECTRYLRVHSRGPLM
jgi:hypothetical protein